MNQHRFHPVSVIAALAIGIALSVHVKSEARAQEPTPTSAPAASGMYITVISNEPQINVRMGPSSIIYPVVGYLLPGETAPALGRSPGGDWVQISFPGAPYETGWVYSPLVSVSPPGVLRVVEPPPTPVPPATPTIDPTLFAQFTFYPTETRLPTFTPAPALTLPVYTEAPAPQTKLPIATGSLALFFGASGLVIFLLSLIRRNK